MSSTNEIQQNIYPLNNEPNISGLTYINDYINKEEQKQLLSVIEQQVWSTKLKRLVQHYGYRYDYQNGSLASASYLGSLPDWLKNLADRLFKDNLTSIIPDQLIINEYQPGQGIASHIDCVPCFGNTIISLSLGSSCVMDFISQTKEKSSILLSPGSLVIMQGDARYNWQHGIAARKKDKYEGKELVRTRRVSITFREVLFPYK